MLEIPFRGFRVQEAEGLISGSGELGIMKKQLRKCMEYEMDAWIL